MRAIGILLVLAVIALVVAFFSGWVSFASDTDTGSTTLRIRVDRAEFREDMQSIGAASKEAAEGVQDAVGALNAEGEQDATDSRNATVRSISTTGGLVTVEFAGGELETLPILAADEALATRLRPGDELVVRSEAGRVVGIERR